MKQVLIIHGGSSFKSYQAYRTDLEHMQLNYDRLLPQQKWRTWIAEQMPEADILLPTMPNGYNANYDEWVIYFEKILPFLNNDVRLVGHSLGAMFLVKYLHDHVLTHKVRQLILIAPGYDDESSEEPGSFKISSAKGLDDSASEIHFFHSKDDSIVPYTELAKFVKDLPGASYHRFEDCGHFNDTTFPELLRLLKK